MRAVFSDRARLAAMLRIETALARAEARFGLAPEGLAAGHCGDRSPTASTRLRSAAKRRSPACRRSPSSRRCRSVFRPISSAPSKGRDDAGRRGYRARSADARGLRPHRRRTCRDPRRARGPRRAVPRDPLCRAHLRPARGAGHLRVQGGRLAVRHRRRRRRNLRRCASGCSSPLSAARSGRSPALGAHGPGRARRLRRRRSASARRPSPGMPPRPHGGGAAFGSRR